MRRREFIALVCWVTRCSSSTSAEQHGRVVYRVGLLRVGPPPPRFIEAFRQGLSDLGYVEGQNIVIEYGLGSSAEQLPDLAADLVRRKVDVLVASGTPSVSAARNAANATPVIFVAGIDPIATGLVMSSLAQPVGNVTGLTSLHVDLTGKRLEVLKEILPTLSQVALLSRPANPGHTQYVREAEQAARALGVHLQVLPVDSPHDFEDAFRAALGASALFPIDDAVFTFHRRKLVELAEKYRLPGVYPVREFVEEGGLIALGPSYSDLYRRAATYVDKVLKGTNPADLPVEQPTKFELVVNLKTAAMLGLSVPTTLLARVDEVIE